MTVAQIKTKVLAEANIVNVVGQYVKLKRQGREAKGLCPFHNERSPSFMVNEKKGIFKCFGCGASGDVIDFVMKHESKTFTEALRLIAASGNIVVDWSNADDVPAWSKEAFEKIKFVEPFVLQSTLSHYESNPFVMWLQSLVGNESAAAAVGSYYVGTAQNNGTIFWLVDQLQRVRTAQKIHYGRDGHRIKAYWPKRLFVQDAGYVACLFGEHLLRHYTPNHFVGIVESEKTAVICSLYLPVLFGRPVIWLACSGSNGLTEDKIWVLKDMNVILVPDFSYVSRAMWGAVPMKKKTVTIEGKEKTIIAEDGELQADYVSAKDKLKRKTTGRIMVLNDWPDINDGSDIADILIKQPFIAPPEELSIDYATTGFDL